METTGKRTFWSVHWEALLFIAGSLLSLVLMGLLFLAEGGETEETDLGSAMAGVFAVYFTLFLCYFASLVCAFMAGLRTRRALKAEKSKSNKTMAICAWGLFAAVAGCGVCFLAFNLWCLLLPAAFFELIFG